MRRREFLAGAAAALAELTHFAAYAQSSFPNDAEADAAAAKSKEKLDAANRLYAQHQALIDENNRKEFEYFQLALEAVNGLRINLPDADKSGKPISGDVRQSAAAKNRVVDFAINHIVDLHKKYIDDMKNANANNKHYLDSMPSDKDVEGQIAHITGYDASVTSEGLTAFDNFSGALASVPANTKAAMNNLNADLNYKKTIDQKSAAGQWQIALFEQFIELTFRNSFDVSELASGFSVLLGICVKNDESDRISGIKRGMPNRGNLELAQEIKDRFHVGPAAQPVPQSPPVPQAPASVRPVRALHN